MSEIRFEVYYELYGEGKPAQTEKRFNDVCDVPSRRWVRVGTMGPYLLRGGLYLTVECMKASMLLKIVLYLLVPPF